MDIIVLPQHWSAIICVSLMIGAIIFAFIKKTMVSYALIISNIIIFLITNIFYNQLVAPSIYLDFVDYAGLGFRPIYLQIEYIPQFYTLFTSMFIHGDFTHILFNMLIFLLIGIPFEQRVGRKNFIIIYILAGICGTIIHSLFNFGSEITLIGASGAIFGIMGAFAYSYPNDRIYLPVFFILMKIKVLYGVIIFSLLETFYIFISINDQTAHLAHIGGLIGGAVFAAIFIRGQPKHDKKGDTIFYDSYVQNRPRKIDINTLRQFATTPELKDMLDRIENEDVLQVKDLWIEHFIEKAVCPKCGSDLNHFNQKIWCEKCGFKTKY